MRVSLPYCKIEDALSYGGKRHECADEISKELDHGRE